MEPAGRESERAAARREPGAQSYARGVFYALAGGVCLSLGGALLRHMESADGWQIVFYRSIGFVLTLSVYLLLRYGPRVPAAFMGVGWPGLVAAVSLGLGTACYVFGMLLTTVANVVFTLSVGPFAAAGVAWLVLGERVHLSTLLAMLAAMGGIGLMFADGLATGHWLGNLVALGAPLTLAVTVVAWRSKPGKDMVPATCLSGVVALVIAVSMSDGLAVSTHDLVLSLLLGSVQLGAGFLCFTLGARSVPSAEVPLYGLSETVLAPIWVWLLVSEVPSGLTLGGGAIVLAAVILAALAGLRSQRARRAAARQGPRA